MTRVSTSKVRRASPVNFEASKAKRSDDKGASISGSAFLCCPEEGVSRVTPGAVAYLVETQAAQAALAAYRAVTKEIALCIGFVLGLFVSLAGVRALSSIVNSVPADNWLFPIADIILTGAIIAGGSDGVHQMVNVFTNFLSLASDKAKAP